MREFFSSHLQKRNKLLLNHLVAAAANLLFRRLPLLRYLSLIIHRSPLCRERVCVWADPPPVKSSPADAGLTSHHKHLKTLQLMVKPTEILLKTEKRFRCEAVSSALGRKLLLLEKCKIHSNSFGMASRLPGGLTLTSRRAACRLEAGLLN